MGGVTEGLWVMGHGRSFKKRKIEHSYIKKREGNNGTGIVKYGGVMGGKGRGGSMGRVN